MEAEFVARPHGQRPAEFVEARADDAARRLELALDEKPHRERGGVPAARREAGEDRAARRFLLEVGGVRIELGREGLDLLLVDGDAPGAVDLADGEVLEVFCAHVADLLCSAAARHGHVKAPNHAPPATAATLINPKATSATLCAKNPCARSPLQRSASQPAIAAIARRVRLATSGQSSRPAPCEAK